MIAEGDIQASRWRANLLFTAYGLALCFLLFRVGHLQVARHEALADLKIESLEVTEHSHAAGRTSLELQVRLKTRALIVAIRRGGSLIEHMDPEDPFQVGDLIFLVGSTDAIREATALLEGGRC